MVIDEYDFYLTKHKDKFGVEPNVICMFWRHPEDVHEGIKKAIKEGESYAEQRRQKSMG